MTRIRFEKVGKQYLNGFVALKDFDLVVEDREFLVLLGPSGCGKSTSLNMIAGLEDISSGSLYFDDDQMNEVPAHRRDVAMVFQSYALYPHKSVFENIAFGLRMRKHPKSQIELACAMRPVDWISRTCLIDGLTNSPADSASGWRWGVQWCASRLCS